MNDMNSAKEILLFRSEETKLSELLAENGLSYTFNVYEYPICLIVSQNTDPGDQMEFYSTDSENSSDKDSRLCFQFSDGEITIRTDSRLIIPDSLMTKIKGKAKKMHYLYLQAYFRASMLNVGKDITLDLLRLEE